MKQIAIVGASGHGKVVAEIAALNGYDRIRFFDDNTAKVTCGKYTVEGTYEDALNTDGDVFIAIGDPNIRCRMMEKIKEGRTPTLVHPKAVVSKDANIGVGTVIMAGAVVGVDTQIGNGVIINTCSSVDHDCSIKDYSHISVGAHLSGTIDVGKKVWIGAGATISNNIEICDNCIIGVGATVVKSIEIPGVYVGVPAKRLR